MKMLYSAGIYGDIPRLTLFGEFARERSDADVIVCTGDFLKGVFRDKEEFNTYNANSSQVYHVSYLNFQHENPLVTARRMVEAHNISEGLRKPAQEYLEFIDKARQRMRLQYGRIRDILRSTGKNFLVMSGSSDCDNLMRDVFGEANLHKRSLNIEGVKFAGYGADGYPVEDIPGELSTRFIEREAYSFLTGEDPNVAVTHIPPFGIADKRTRCSLPLIQVVHEGSFGIRSYLQDIPPDILLCGHSEIPAMGELNGAHIINPGNLGDRPTRDIRPSSGRFTEIEIDENYHLKNVRLLRIAGAERNLDGIVEEAIR